MISHSSFTTNLPPLTVSRVFFFFPQTHSHHAGVRGRIRGVCVGRTGGVCARVVGVCVAAVHRAGEVQRHSGGSRIHRPRQPPGSHTPVSAPTCENG